MLIAQKEQVVVLLFRLVFQLVIILIFTMKLILVSLCDEYLYVRV